MVNFFYPENNNLNVYDDDTLLYYLDKYNVAYSSDKNIPGYIVFELVSFLDIGDIPSNLSASEMSDLQNGKHKLLLFFAREPIGYLMIFSQIEALNNCGISNQSIVVVTGNHGAATLSQYPSDLKAVAFFMFDMTTKEKYKGGNHFATDPSHVFLCYNSVMKLHRSLMFLLLPHDRGHISYLKRKYQDDVAIQNEVDMCKTIPAELANKAKHMVNTPGKTLELTLDECIYNQFNDDFGLYHDTAFSIVTESLYCDLSLFLTEKTFKPILSMHPFVLLSSPGSHEFLESFGYRTYRELFAIDKIDQEADIYKKSCMIKHLVESFDINTYKEAIGHIHHIAQHNRNMCLHNDYQGRLQQLLGNLKR